MIKDRFSRIIEENKNSGNKFFLRNLLKEAVQDDILNFVYNHRFYQKLIFTGGTCLRKVYGLPRLSEDLDFDFLGKFKIEDFAAGTKDYFAKELQYKNVVAKISGSGQTVFLKFPVNSQILFVRCDFSPETIGIFTTEVNSVSTSEFTFFALSYDLSTLFANKITALLQRRFFRGKEQKTPFKGRDVFDLSWFLERSTKTRFSLQPNWKRVFKALGIKNKQEIIKKLREKLEMIDRQSLYRDLLPFVEQSQTAENFSKNFLEIIGSKLKYL